MNPPASAQVAHIERATKQWLEEAVIGLNLCPFARREYDADRVRFAICEGKKSEELLLGFAAELERLERDRTIETSLVIFAEGVDDFYDFLDLLEMAQGWLDDQALDGVYQLASFHPQYQFEGTSKSDPSNYTNRSPWPIIHLLREDSVAKAIAGHPDTGMIPQRNVALAREKGVEFWKQLLARASEQ